MKTACHCDAPRGAQMRGRSRDARATARYSSGHRTDKCVGTTAKGDPFAALPPKAGEQLAEVFLVAAG